MNRDIIVHIEAEAEIFQALAWYAERSAIAARAFVQELSSMVVLAARSPETWPRGYGNTRHIVFPRFPFDLVFRMKGKTTEIVAVAHQRRRPRYWKDR
jgi:plasmid stabilization system protein ParE